MDQTKLKSKDLILVLSLLIIGGILFLFLYLNGGSGATVQVTVDGVLVEERPLKENASFTVENPENGGSNKVVIEDGYVYVENATCPDKLCEHMSKISKNGQSIVCLPNRVVVEVKSDSKSDQAEYDSIVQ